MRAYRWPMLALCGALLLSGCKHYDYHLVEPQQFAQRIGPEPATVSLPPLNYRMARSHGRLAINIENPTDQPIEILGHRSFVVDPKGTSHPVRGTPVAPRSFVPLMLPPVPMTYQVYAPFAYRSPWWWSSYQYPFYDDWYGWWYDPYPLTYSVEVRTPHDWTWRQGAMRLRLAYQYQGQALEHEFLFERRPAK